MRSAPVDPRRNAFRADLADRRLEGRVTAERFVDGVPRQIGRASAPMTKAPDASLGLENEVLFGELVRVFDEREGFAWVQLQRDDYVGYVPSSALAQDIKPVTHRVRVPGTFVYPEPSIKTAPSAAISLNSGLAVCGKTSDGRFVELATGGFVFARHVAERDAFARDFVDVAEHLVYTPYRWGGRTREGLDCSALVQLSLEAAGIAAPRDSDMGAAEIGETVLIPADLEGLQRGDIVYWRGHCGIMIDGVLLIHANGHAMQTVIEPLSEVVRRARKAEDTAGTASREIVAIRRVAALRRTVGV